jgi:hypothetical protein
MRALGFEDRREQIDRPRRPVRQTATAQPQPRRLNALMLAVERQMILELVDQHTGEQAHIGHALLQHRRRAHRGADLAALAQLVDALDVLDDFVAGGALRETVGHLLADDLAGRLRQTLDRRVADGDLVHRYRRIEAQAGLGEAVVAQLLALVGHRLGRNCTRRQRGGGTEPGKQVALHGGIDEALLLARAPEELALEPVELGLEGVNLRLKRVVFSAWNRDALRGSDQRLRRTHGAGLYPGMQSLGMRISLVLPSFPKIDAFEQQLQPRPVQRHLLSTIRAVVKAAALEAFTPQAVAAAIKIQHLHLRAFAVDEDKQVAVGRVFVQHLLHQCR